MNEGATEDYSAKINESPDEVLSKIFSYLTPVETATSRLVCTHWRNVIGDSLIMRAKIKTIFPYLEALHPVDFDKNPQKLFNEEFKKCLGVFDSELVKSTDVASQKYFFQNKDTKTELLLAAYQGDIDKIESAPVSDYVKELLFIRAAGNGHTKAIDLLLKNVQKFDANTKILSAPAKALFHAVSNQHLSAVQKILERVQPLCAQIANFNMIFPFQLSKIILEPLKNNRFDIIDIFLFVVGPMIAGKAKAEIIKVAITERHFDRVHKLLTLVGPAISQEDMNAIIQQFGKKIDELLIKMINSKEASMEDIGELLNKIDPLCANVDLRLEYYGAVLKAWRMTLDDDNLKEIAGLLLKYLAEVIQNHNDLPHALKPAAFYGNIGIIREYATQNLPFSQIILEALNSACSNPNHYKEHDEIFEMFFNPYRNMIAPLNLDYYLEKAAENGKTSILKMLIANAGLRITILAIGNSLCLAAKAGHFECVDILLIEFENLISPQSVTDALLLAAKEGHDNIIKIIIDRAYDKIIEEKYNQALISACSNKHAKSVQELLTHVKTKISNLAIAQSLEIAANGLTHSHTNVNTSSYNDLKSTNLQIAYFLLKKLQGVTLSSDEKKVIELAQEIVCKNGFPSLVLQIYDVTNIGFLIEEHAELNRQYGFTLSAEIGDLGVSIYIHNNHPPEWVVEHHHNPQQVYRPSLPHRAPVPALGTTAEPELPQKNPSSANILKREDCYEPPLRKASCILF